MSIIIALCALSFLVFFHELGHFIFASLCGVHVEVFSIGFGKKILSIHIKNTQYALSLIPLGGYVKLKGQDDSNPKLQNNEADSYMSKTPLQRIIILLAGPFFNFLLAFLLYIFIGIGGKMSLLPIVGDVRVNYPASVANLQAGDRILSINHKEIKTWEELDSMIMHSNGALLMRIERGGVDSHIFEIFITPIKEVSKNIFGEPITRNVIGIISSNVTGEIKYSPWESLVYAMEEIWKSSTLIIQGIIKLISGVVPTSEIGGVVGIVSVIGLASDNSLGMFFWFIALISVNLAILNLLPIPALDGGHILFNCYELIMHVPPNKTIEYYLTLCGWAILLALMLLGLYNDILRLSF